MTTDLAEKVVARGLDLNGGEPAWEAYHLAKDVLELRGQADRYRIEADCGLRDYDALEVDAGIMFAALETIAIGRRNELFDPWARQAAKDALDLVTERVTALSQQGAGGAS